jgi:hypothetical protein
VPDDRAPEICDHSRTEHSGKQTKKEYDKGAGSLAGKRGVVKITPGFRI